MDVLGDLLGQASSIVALREQIRQILARTSHAHWLPPLLLQGETGTGKNLVAHVIHRAGPRGAGPFVDVNCAAIPDGLLEAELFGFERGAFTDARQPKAGLFQRANGGTIFLDEIALLADPLQAKLLQVVEERSVRRLGSTRSEPVDVSIIAATNEDLIAAVQTRRFRQDLYHRLAVLTLRLPRLRERRDDIPLLAEHFLGRACRDYGLPPKVLTPAAQAALGAYPWPGNVRELANLMERVALLVETAHVGPDVLDLPTEAAALGPRSALTATPGSSLDARVEAWERDEVLRALHETGWNVARAAVRLGITRNTIRYRIVKYRLEPPARRAQRRRARPIATAQPAPPSAPPLLSAVTRWERRLVALLRATVHPLDGETDSWTEFGRDIDTVAQKVESFTGRVEEAGPARIVAAFGLDPVEDAAGRAALAAMAIQNALRRARPSPARRAAVTLAIHADECLVGDVSGRARIDVEAYRRMATVLEDLGGRTESDTAFVSPTVRSLLGPRFVLDEAGEGDAGSSRGWRLLAYSQHRYGLGGHPGPFVGREHELRVLQTLWREALQGRGQIVAVVGEPGIGKSRLLFEFHAALGDGPLTYLEGRGESYGGGIPYLPVIGLLKEYFHIDVRDDPPAMAEKVTAQLLVLDPALAPDLSALLVLLGAPGADPQWQRLEPPQRRQRTLDALRRFVLRVSQAQPVLLAIEDLHWIDTGTLAFLDRLITGLPGARLLVLVSYRPEFRHGWGSGSASYTQLHLHPLPTVSAEELVGGLVGHDIALQPLRRLLIERSGGNPFFLEESVRSLIDMGALVGVRGAYRPAHDLQRPPVPPTVSAVLATRIDKLPPEDKQVLQAAAVIGKDVPYSLLQAITNLAEADLSRAIERLQAAEFVYEARLVPDPAYTFKHALTHEVAYGSLRRDQQRALHATIVSSLEALYPDRLIEHVDRLAHHAFRGELWREALTYFRQAGARDFARSAYRESATAFQQALEAVGHLPETGETLEQAVDLHLDLRHSLFPLGELDQVLGHLREAERLATRLGDQRRLAMALTLLGNLISMTGHSAEATTVAQQALDVADSLRDLRLQVRATYTLGVGYDNSGHYRQAEEALGTVVGWLEGPQTRENFGLPGLPVVTSRAFLAGALGEQGKFTRGITIGQEAIRLGEMLDNPYGLIWACFRLALVHCARGDLGHALPLLERAADLCRVWNVLLFAPRVAGTLGYVRALSGRIEEGLVLVEEALRAPESMAAGSYYALVLAQHSEVCGLAGRAEEALASAERAAEIAKERGLLGFKAYALRFLGDIASRRGSPAVADEHYWRAMALARELEMRPLVARCHLGLGVLCRHTGDAGAARQHLTTAVGELSRMGMQTWREQAEAELAALG